MPFENEHACRLKDPNAFKKGSFRRTKRKHEGKTYSIIMGRLKGETTMTEQAYRYGKDTWSASQARTHCKDHEGSFEAAKKEASSMKKQNDDIERRELPLSEFRIERRDDGPTKFIGYVARFNILSEDLFGFKEMINPGAFAETIEKDDVRMLFNHNRDYVLGRTRSKTLTLEEDDKGLKVENEFPDTQWARDLATSVERKDINQGSFGFRALEESWDDKGKIPIRSLEKVTLHDVSIVTFPAYKQTRVQTRDLMAEDGINLDSISRVWVKSQHGLEINEDDRVEINDVIDSLRAMVKKDEIIREPEKDPQQTPRLNFLKMKLDNKLKTEEITHE